MYDFRASGWPIMLCRGAQSWVHSLGQSWLARPAAVRCIIFLRDPPMSVFSQCSMLLSERYDQLDKKTQLVARLASHLRVLFPYSTSEACNEYTCLLVFLAELIFICFLALQN